MYFNEQQILQLEQGLEEVHRKKETLLEKFVLRSYRSTKAEEFAKHGFCRRLGTMERCLDNVFHLLPPKLDEIPSQTKVHDAIINLHAFSNNTFGCCDNLAWIWVHEMGITGTNRRPISPKEVGISKKKIRNSFPVELANYILEIDAWIDYVKNYRDALCHRIPMYIPPYTIDPKDEELYNVLEEWSYDALIKGDIDRHAQLKQQSQELEFFRPIAIHSFSEGTSPIMVHNQMINDFYTVYEIGERFFCALK